MRIISLNGEWRLSYYDAAAHRVDHPDQLNDPAVQSIPAQVPGNVELDLLRAGRLPGIPADAPLDALLEGRNILLPQEYETYDWWYETSFDSPDTAADQPVELVFDGVDCLAEYWLNGELLGISENMFIEQRFEVANQLQPQGKNHLIVCLRSALLEAAEKEYPATSISLSTNREQLWIRKAPHSYGWDIMPRVLSAGLWRGVSLAVHETHDIREVYCYTRALDAHSAWVGIDYTLETDAWRQGLTLRARGVCGNSTFEATHVVRFPSGRFEFAVEHPKLWWPLGYGDPNCYDLTLELLSPTGKVIAARQETVGIRLVELLRTETTSAHEPGEFLFKINHTPILCKGSNHVPANAFHSRDAERYDTIIDLFAAAGCNIIRCWGGNVYEDHAFFERCDRAGIMVWQDFAMACAFHPQEAEFLEQMRAEATAVVRKLRNHPALILWCGDNEVDQSLFGHQMDPAHNQITRDVLPAVTFANDPYRPYLPSSPYYAPEVVAARDESRMPEQHCWGPRDYYKSDFYKQHTAHFVSEIGFHGCPNRAAIEQFLSPDAVWPWQDNEEWIIHCTDAIGKDGPYAYRVALMARQIAEMFGSIPDHLDDFILASQISQAEAKKYFIEMTRLKKWRRTGLIWWNMIDGWPQFSDAVVDYYGGKKLAFHYIRRAQQPVCLMIDEPENWHVRLAAGNDSRADARGTYRVWDADSGETLAFGDYAVPANQNIDLARIPVSRGAQRLFLIEWTVGAERFGSHYLLGSPAFSLDQYRQWLNAIAELPLGFDPGLVGK